MNVTVIASRQGNQGHCCWRKNSPFLAELSKVTWKPVVCLLKPATYEFIFTVTRPELSTQSTWPQGKGLVAFQCNHGKTAVVQGKTMVFSNSDVQMWELDQKEGWVPKNWCFRIVVLEKTLERPLDSKEIKLVNPKENQPWIFIGRIDPEAEAPILCIPDANSQITGKDPSAGKDWRQKEKGVAENEVVR